MNSFNVGDAVGAGFHLIRTKPGAVLLWGLIQIVAFTGLFAMMAGTISPMATAAAAAQAQGAQPDLELMMRAQSVIFLAEIVVFAIDCVVYCAVLRSILRPEDSRFGYLRLGGTEAWFILAYFVLIIILGLGMFVIAAPLAIVAGLAHAHAAILLLVVLLLVVMTYVLLRLSMAWPMIVETGRFRLFESWSLTRGRVGSLFLTALASVAVVLLIEVILMVAVLIASGMSPGHSSSAIMLNPFDAFRRSIPTLIVGAVVGIPTFGAIAAITIAPFAWIYRQIGGRIPSELVAAG